VFRTRFRQRRAVSLAVVAFGGCLVLAACGAVQMGAAAIVGGQRITTATLTTQVANLDNYYRANRAKLQLGFPVSQMPQQVLSWLIRFQVRDELAAREGITVTPAEIQQAIREISAQAAESGESGAGLTALAVANGLPPDLIGSGLGRYQAIASALAARLDGGVSPTSSSGEEALDVAFNHEQCLAAKSLDIKVNPQFGRLNYAQLGVVPAPSTLSAPEGAPSPAPTASGKPEYSPPC
jgi:hypothetical protein